MKLEPPSFQCSCSKTRMCSVLKEQQHVSLKVIIPRQLFVSAGVPPSPSPPPPPYLAPERLLWAPLRTAACSAHSSALFMGFCLTPTPLPPQKSFIAPSHPPFSPTQCLIYKCKIGAYQGWRFYDQRIEYKGIGTRYTL